MRITHSMIVSHYINQLNTTLTNFNNASTQSTDYRAYRRTSDDPFSASKALRLRREYQQNDDYQRNISDVESQLDTAQGVMTSLNSSVQDISSGDCLQAITGTTPKSERDIITKKLVRVQESIVSMLNTKFSNKYVFGGAQTDNPPFSVDDNGNLLFRGINVDTGAIAAGTTATINNAELQFGKATGTSFNGYTVQIASGAVGSPDSVSVSGTTITVSMDMSVKKTNNDLLTTLQSATGLTDSLGHPLDFSKITMNGDMSQTITAGTTSTVATDNVGQNGLKALANETSYVDIGLGLQFNSDGTINPQSVFNSAIPGLSFIGYGTTDSGMPNNLYSQLNEIVKQLKSDSFSMNSIKPYLDAFSKQGDNLLSEITKSGTNSAFLETKKTQLENQSDKISEKDDSVEYVDPAMAIMNYKMAQYSYRAALQMGVNILQPTFLDFMK